MYLRRWVNLKMKILTLSSFTTIDGEMRGFISSYATFNTWTKNLYLLRTYWLRHVNFKRASGHGNASVIHLDRMFLSSSWSELRGERSIFIVSNIYRYGA